MVNSCRFFAPIDNMARFVTQKLLGRFLIFKGYFAHIYKAYKKHNDKKSLNPTHLCEVILIGLKNEQSTAAVTLSFRRKTHTPSLLSVLPVARCSCSTQLKPVQVVSLLCRESAGARHCPLTHTQLEIQTFYWLSLFSDLTLYIYIFFQHKKNFSCTVF